MPSHVLGQDHKHFAGLFDAGPRLRGAGSLTLRRILLLRRIPNAAQDFVVAQDCLMQVPCSVMQVP